jgi:hypothetical protein
LRPDASPVQGVSETPDAYAVVLMGFDTLDVYGRSTPMQKKAVREIRLQIRGALRENESVLFYGEGELLIFMPGVSSESLPARVRSLREAFHSWQADRFEDRRAVRLNLGFSVCEGEEDLSRTLEVASLVMHPETDDEPGNLPES